MKIKLIIFVFVHVLIPDDTEAIVGGEPSKPPPPDDPVVFVTKHGKTARVLGTRDDRYYAFRGMRYAQPPIGRNRFMRPITYHMQGDIDATKYGPPCLQQTYNQYDGTWGVIGSEDCLHINVFSVQLPDGGEGAPVVVWIHGGGFGEGSGAQYDAKKLTEQRLVVVTFNYRLGSLGYLSSNDKDLQGNAGLCDMTMALRWVRDYIGFFGGNPKNVVTMGHETGASSATLLSSSRLSRSYQQGVIAMSGSPLSHWTIDNNVKGPSAERLARSLKCDCNDTVKTVRCLQNVSAEEIVQMESSMTNKSLADVTNSLVGLRNAGPVVDGAYDYRGLPTFIMQEPIKSLKGGMVPKIPLLIGVTANETSGAVNGKMKKQFMEQLKEFPDFIEKRLAGQLQKTANAFKIGFLDNPITDLIDEGLNGFLGQAKNKKASSSGQNSKNLFGNVLQPFNPAGNIIDQTIKTTTGFTEGIFKNYLKVPAGQFGLALNKISEVTGDVFFNVPMYLTASLWTKSGAPTYMYQFNHKGNRPKGYDFLKRSALTNSERDSSIGHGDDLSYIFDPLSITGEPMNVIDRGELTHDDQQVRKHMLQMITEFANNGQKYPRKVAKRLLTPFNEKNNNYLNISPKPTSENNFRFCEVAIWGGLEDRLKSPFCSFLNVANQISGGLLSPLGGGNNNKKPSAFGGSLLGTNSVLSPKIGGNSRGDSSRDLKNIKLNDFF